MPMRFVSVTDGRKQLGELINVVKYQHQVIALGKNGKADALLISFPDVESDIPMTGINGASTSFRFLEDEPDLYTVSDLKVKYG